MRKLQLIVHKQYKTRNSTSCQWKKANSGKRALQICHVCFGGCEGERSQEEQIATIKTEERPYMGILQDHGWSEKPDFIGVVLHHRKNYGIIKAESWKKTRFCH